MSVSVVPSELRADLIECVHRVQSLPYSWPAPPEAAWTRTAGTGTCAGKHALLAEDLAALGLRCRPLLMVGPLVPDVWPDLLAEGKDLQEVHECLSVETDWAGPLLVDVTWHPAAIRGGLPGTLNWSGDRDMQLALSPVSCYAVSRNHLRAQKEKLRDRLYTPAQRLRRHALLAELARRASALETQERDVEVAAVRRSRVPFPRRPEVRHQARPLDHVAASREGAGVTSN